MAVTRAEIIAYLQALGQPFREDASNLDLQYTRNRIRHELLPHLAGNYNPSVVQVLASLAAQAEEAYRVEEAAALACSPRWNCRAPERCSFLTARDCGQPHVIECARCSGRSGCARAGRWAAWIAPPGNGWRRWFSRR
jgi:tRNA(Ile)-lysidine synthase TilS/MesJ